MLLRKLIQEEMQQDEREISNAELSEVIGVSTGHLSNFFNRKANLSFIKIASIARFLCENNAHKEFQIVENSYSYIKTPSDMKAALEWASINRREKMLSYLIDTCKKGTNKELNDWAKAYDLYGQYQFHTKTSTEISNLINDLECKYPEPKILIHVLDAVNSYILKDYKQLHRSTKLAERYIKNLEDSFIKDSFENRINEVKAKTLLFVRVDIEAARECCSRVINSKIAGRKFIADSYEVLGHSYFLDDYSQCISAFNTSRRLLIEDGRTDFAKALNESNIAFAKVHWGRDLEDFTSEDISELAHYEAKWGSKEKAIELLNRAEKEYTSPFRKYYRGLATNDPKHFLESFSSFMSRGDKYFAKLPLEASRNFINEHSMMESFYNNFILY